MTDADEILDLLAEAAVVVVPGRIAHALGPRPPLPCPFVRLSFASASEAELQVRSAPRLMRLCPIPCTPPPAGGAHLCWTDFLTRCLRYLIKLQVLRW